MYPFTSNDYKKINNLGVKTVSYNIDDPFGPKAHVKVPWHHHFLWFWYIKCLHHFQYNLLYRQINVDEAKKWELKYKYFITIFYSLEEQTI